MNTLRHPMSGSTNGRRLRRGAAATEAAIVLPVLLTLAIGAVDFGRIFGLSVQLSNAVQAGAESGATHRPTSVNYNSWLTRVRTAVMDDLSDSTDFNTSQVSIAVDLLTDSQGNQQVYVTANYLFRTIVNWPLVPNQVPLKSQVIMRQYR